MASLVPGRVERPLPKAHAAGLLAVGLLSAGACTDDADDLLTDAELGVSGDAASEQRTDHGHATTPDDAATDHDAAVGDSACEQPYPKDPRDDTMTGELVRLVTGDNGTPDDPADDPYDLLLPQEMLDWLEEQNWIQEHGDWHNVRRWDQGCQRMMQGGPCQAAEAMAARGLQRAPIQEGEPGDGFAFLAMHRHMIRGFMQAFPTHGDLIRGFYHVPTHRLDSENPLPWVDVRWGDEQLESIAFMENIEQHLDAFTSEDDYAKWVQFGDGFPLGGFGGGLPPGFAFPDGGIPDVGAAGFPGGGSPGGFPAGAGGAPGLIDGGVAAPTDHAGSDDDDAGTSNRPSGGIHGPLHGQWTIPNSPVLLTDNNKNVQNFAFWRLHGWIDDMWERYRRARGLGEDDPDYQKELIAQCEEMHELGKALPLEDVDAGGSGEGGGGTPETGVFATQVAPILNSYCAGSVCHDAASPTLGLALTAASPSTIREGIVGKQATELAMALVAPGKPEESWLYRKVSGDFDGIDCGATQCTTMPLAGIRPTEQELARIRAWIEAGAGGD